MRMAGCRGLAGSPKSSMSAAWPASRGWWATWEKRGLSGTTAGHRGASGGLQGAGDTASNQRGGGVANISGF